MERRQPPGPGRIVNTATLPLTGLYPAMPCLAAPPPCLATYLVPLGSPVQPGRPGSPHPGRGSDNSTCLRHYQRFIEPVYYTQLCTIKLSDTYSRPGQSTVLYSRFLISYGRQLLLGRCSPGLTLSVGLSHYRALIPATPPNTPTSRVFTVQPTEWTTISDRKRFHPL